MILTAYTIFHVVISLVAIASGLVVLFGMLAGTELGRWTGAFLTTTVATSVTGFFFPFHGFTPALGFGILSLVLLAVAIFARSARRLAGAWRKTYVLTSLFALYLNMFVLIVQAFDKVPALKEIAPTPNAWPFKLAQLVLLVAFLVLATVAAIRFRPEPVSTGAAANTESPGGTVPLA